METPKFVENLLNQFVRGCQTYSLITRKLLNSAITHAYKIMQKQLDSLFDESKDYQKVRNITTNKFIIT